MTNTLDRVISNSMKLIEEHEGFMETAYFDSEGHLTTGYGTLIPDKETYVSMDWQRKGHRLTPTQKDVNYDEIMELKGEYGSNRKAKSQTKMEEFGSIPKPDLRMMAEDHIQNKTIPDIQKTLRKDGIDFNTLPLSVQTALVDIEYNTGNFKSFTNMRKAIQKMDFEQMAKESHRAPPVPERRNKAVYDLIIQGQSELEY